MSDSNTHSTTDNQPTAAPTEDQLPAPAEGGAGADPATGGQQEQASGEVLGAGAGNTTEKDPDDWVTGDEPMTGAQRSYLDTLARDAGETVSADLTKAQPSEHIDRLQQATGRGTDQG